MTRTLLLFSSVAWVASACLDDVQPFRPSPCADDTDCEAGSFCDFADEEAGTCERIPDGEGEEEGDGEPSQSCIDLCTRILACADDVNLGADACGWIAEGDRAFCEAQCDDAEASNLESECIVCLADNLSCIGTAAMRGCDAACEPTSFATGRDFEGALEYDYARYFCEGED